MRKLRRVAFHLLAGVSLLVLIATIAAWVRSAYMTDSFFESRVDVPPISVDATPAEKQRERTRQSSKWIQSVYELNNGGLRYYRLTYPVTRDFATHNKSMGIRPLRHFQPVRSMMPGGQPGGHWFRWKRAPDPQGRGEGLEIAVPLWPLVLSSAISPVIWLQRHRNRPRPGYCSNCGYDLRATPTRCPECGTIPTGLQTPSTLSAPARPISFINQTTRADWPMVDDTK